MDDREPKGYIDEDIEEEIEEKKDTYDFFKNINWPRLANLLLFIAVCLAAWVLITDGSRILTNLSDHILGLFSRARIYPRPNQHFIQLLLITVFVGWAITRFRKKK